MKSVAARIDKMKARHEQVVRIQEISSVLHDWHGPDLSTVGHVVLEVSPSSSSSFIGVARGAVGAPAPPRAVKNIFSGLIYRQNV